MKIVVYPRNMWETTSIWNSHLCSGEFCILECLKAGRVNPMIVIGPCLRKQIVKYTFKKLPCEIAMIIRKLKVTDLVSVIFWCSYGTVCHICFNFTILFFPEWVELPALIVWFLLHQPLWMTHEQQEQWQKDLQQGMKGPVPIPLSFLPPARRSFSPPSSPS